MIANDPKTYVSKTRRKKYTQNVYVGPILFCISNFAIEYAYSALYRLRPTITDYDKMWPLTATYRTVVYYITITALADVDCSVI